MKSLVRGVFAVVRPSDLFADLDPSFFAIEWPYGLEHRRKRTGKRNVPLANSLTFRARFQVGESTFPHCIASRKVRELLFGKMLRFHHPISRLEITPNRVTATFLPTDRPHRHVSTTASRSQNKSPFLKSGCHMGSRAAPHVVIGAVYYRASPPCPAPPKKLINHSAAPSLAGLTIDRYFYRSTFLRPPPLRGRHFCSCASLGQATSKKRARNPLTSNACR